jgi:hypothetical protein
MLLDHGQFKIMIVAIGVWLTLLVISPLAYADEKEPSSRFSGNIQLGGMWTNSTSQLRVYDTNETTGDLDSEADSFNVVNPIVLFDLKYRIKEQTTLHAGTPIDEYGIRLSAGVAHDFGTPGLLDASLFWSPMHQEWQDPYIAGFDRDETSVLDVGIDLKYNRILGTGFQARGIYNYIDLDKDLIGERYADLQRDGVRYTLNFGYAFQLDRANKIVPIFDFTRADMDGESNSYNSYRILLNYSRFTRRYMLNAYLGGGATQYDKIHPIYGETRNDSGLGGFAILTWFKPFNWQRAFTSLGIGAGYSDANLNFYDSRSIFTLATIGYNF